MSHLPRRPSTRLRLTRRRLIAALLLAGLAALALQAACGRGPAETERFVGLADRYLGSLYAHDPVWATQLGNHDHDGELPDLSLGSLEAWVDLNRAYQDSLQAMNPQKLDPQDRIDREILLQQIEATIFMHEELREAHWNPLLYNTGDAIYALLARDFAPLSQRLHSVAQRLEKIPALLETARVNLVDPPAVFTRTAITQNLGTINLVMDGLDRHLEVEPELRARLARPRAEAIVALSLYGTWLEQDLLPRSTGDFRLGAEKWRQKLRYSLASDLSPEAILATADHSPGEFPAPVDQNSPVPDVWVVGSTTGPGSLDLVDLTNNTLPVTSAPSIGFPISFLLRTAPVTCLIAGGPCGGSICLGDGSGAPCGCGNESAPGAQQGCLNGLGVGASISATGNADTTADSLSFTIAGLPAQPGLLLQGNVVIGGGQGATFGDGLRCCGQGVIRLEILVGQGSEPTTVTSSVVISAHPAQNLQPGSSRCYQYWYRDPAGSPCGSNFNFSSAMQITWV